MRYTQAEKMEIIRTVEESDIGVRPMLRELDINPSTFYQWYRRYIESGYDGLANKRPKQSLRSIMQILQLSMMLMNMGGSTISFLNTSRVVHSSIS